jgi:hypothetical protein
MLVASTTRNTGVLSFYPPRYFDETVPLDCDDFHKSSNSVHEDKSDVQGRVYLPLWVDAVAVDPADPPGVLALGGADAVIMEREWGGFGDDKSAQVRVGTHSGDDGSFEWTRLQDMHTPRQSFAAGQLNDGRIIVVGGSGTTMGEAEIMDMGANTWTKVPMEHDTCGGCGGCGCGGCGGCRCVGGVPRVRDAGRRRVVVGGGGCGTILQHIIKGREAHYGFGHGCVGTVLPDGRFSVWPRIPGERGAEAGAKSTWNDRRAAEAKLLPPFDYKAAVVYDPIDETWSASALPPRVRGAPIVAADTFGGNLVLFPASHGGSPSCPSDEYVRLKE